MSDLINDIDKAMKRVPINDSTRLFWEIITGHRTPQKLKEAVLEMTPPITETKQ